MKAIRPLPKCSMSSVVNCGVSFVAFACPQEGRVVLMTAPTSLLFGNSRPLALEPGKGPGCVICKVPKGHAELRALQ
jgi:hypothetical protein